MSIRKPTTLYGRGVAAMTVFLACVAAFLTVVRLLPGNLWILIPGSAVAFVVTFFAGGTVLERWTPMPADRRIPGTRPDPTGEPHDPDPDSGDAPR